MAWVGQQREECARRVSLAAFTALQNIFIH